VLEVLSSSREAKEQKEQGDIDSVVDDGVGGLFRSKGDSSTSGWSAYCLTKAGLAVIVSLISVGGG